MITELEQLKKNRTKKLRKAIILSILFVIMGIIEIPLEGKFLSKTDGRLVKLFVSILEPIVILDLDKKVVL